jgi:aryl-alcohol dehydrogenase-like predicted oxidoreductase
MISRSDFGLIGFGCMKASWPDAVALNSGVSRDEVISALHFALDSGVLLLDTADIYAPAWNAFGHNEVLVAEAVRSWNGTAEQKSKVIIATKAGITRQPGEAWGRNGSTDYLLRAVEASAARMQHDEIALWQHHRLDPSLSLRTQLEAIKAVQAQGIVKRVGVSNYSAEQLRIAISEIGAAADGGVVSIQNQLNPSYRIQLDVIEVCEEFGIVYLPWSPLAGARESDRGEATYKAFVNVAHKRGESVQTIALAWVASFSDCIVPIPGVTKVSSVISGLQSIKIQLTAEEIFEINELLPESKPLDPDVENTLHVL